MISISQLDNLYSEVKKEFAFADHVLCPKDPRSELMLYEDYHDYVYSITKMRVEYITTCNVMCHSHNNFLFVGSGPLPMTALLLYRFFGITVTCLEKDKDSANKSMQLITYLGCDEYIKILNIDALNFEYYHIYDTILFAVFLNYKPKLYIKILNKISKLPLNGHILVRSSNKPDSHYKSVPKCIYSLFSLQKIIPAITMSCNDVLVFDSLQ